MKALFADKFYFYIEFVSKRLVYFEYSLIPSPRRNFPIYIQKAIAREGGKQEAKGRNIGKAHRETDTSNYLF